MSLENELFKDFQSDEDSTLKGGSMGGKFGLNTGAELVKFEFNPNGGKDNSPANCLDIQVNIGEKKFMQRFYEITKVYGKDGEITDKESEAYKKAFNDAGKQLRGVITHYMKIFHTEEEIKAALAKTSINNFVDYFKFATEAVKNGIQKKGPEVDVFLQWQWQISSGQDKTYLELPKNMKDGSFICKPIATSSSWKEVRDAKKGLSYVDESGAEHRFKRDANYLTSNKAIQQKEGSSSQDMGGSASAGTTGGW